MAKGEAKTSPASEPEPGPVAALRKLDRAVGTAEHAVAAAALAVLVGAGLWQSFASHVLDWHATWPYELIRYSVFFVAMSGAALAAQRGRMFSMDFVSNLLGTRTRLGVQIVIALFVIFACVLLCIGGLEVRRSALAVHETYDIIPPGLGLLALPVGAALIAVHYALHGVIDAFYLITRQTPPADEAPRAH